jgi:hypothetical protein
MVAAVSVLAVALAGMVALVATIIPQVVAVLVI